ncbi:MAG TPA: alanine racemase [Clostridiales bacterium]|nr:MAG: alanine racemase [Clostridiales bacterium GWD2_32_19]HCC08205.1 alanine racemase [Clostridiales bacterium]
MNERVIAEINMSNLKHNLGEVRKCINNNTKVMGVVKTNAYGHGIIEISKGLEAFGIDSFGVAIAEEALELRKNGITKPILIMGYLEQNKVTDIVKNDIMQTIFRYEDALLISEEAKKQDVSAKIQIKIDTGMNRIGFKIKSDLVDDLKKIYELPNIMVEGLYTHLYAADKKNKTMSRIQIEIFQNIIVELEKSGLSIPNKHVLNSAGVIDLGREFSMDFVRTGIMLYGLFASDEIEKNNADLKPVMSVKTKVIFVKEVEIGEGISYGADYITKRKTMVATIPVGYADGYSRKLTNIGRVLIKGQYANITGKVCMNQFMVDVTDIKDVNIGDEVVLFGEQGGNKIGTEEIAQKCNTIEHEILSRINDRVEKKYLF